MANNFLEYSTIVNLLTGKLTIKELRDYNIEISHFPTLSNVYEWVGDYYDNNNNKIPSLELCNSKFNYFNGNYSDDNPIEILKSLKKSSEDFNFNSFLHRIVSKWNNTKDIKNSISYIQKELEKFEENAVDDLHELTSENFTFGREDFLKRRDAYLEKGSYGIPSGLGQEFDTHVQGGFNPGNLYGIVGETGIGKSWMAMVIAKGAMSAGYTPLYVALEGDIKREYYRLHSILNETSNDNIRSGRTTIEEFDESEGKIRQFAKDKNVKLWLATYGNREHYTVATLKQKVRKTNPDILIVDYLTLMSQPHKDADWSMYLSLSRQLKALATNPQKQIPVIVIMQAVIGDDGKEYMDLSSVASSRGVSRDMDGMFGIKKVKGKKYIIQLNDIKGRDIISDSEQLTWAAYFRTNWDKGIIKFQSFADTSGETF